MKTVTGQLAKRMADCKKEQNRLLREMRTLSSVARKRHDQVVTKMQGIPDDSREWHEHNAVRNGLLSTKQYLDSFVENETGQKPPEPPSHDVRGLDHRFVKKNSLSHKLKRLFDDVA